MMADAGLFSTIDQELAPLRKEDIAFSDFSLSTRNSITFDLRDELADFSTKLCKLVDEG